MQLPSAVHLLTQDNIRTRHVEPMRSLCAFAPQDDMDDVKGFEDLLGSFCDAKLAGANDSYPKNKSHRRGGVVMLSH